MKTRMLLYVVFLFSVVFVASCRKENTAQMTIKMTDAPADFLSVNVDIISVEMMVNDDWITLPTNAGVYDLLELQHNVSVVISPRTDIPAGSIRQMRLILGPHNTVETSLGLYPMMIPSGSETGLKLNLNTEVAPDTEMMVVIDFDAKASVVLEGNGTYLLKPHLKVESITRF